MMLKLLSVSSPHAVGVRLSGKVNHNDMDTIVNEVERKLKDEDRLGIYIELDHFEGFTLRGFLRETRFALRYMGHITRAAMVGESRWFTRASTVITRFFPNVEIEHFTPIQKDEALIWVAEKDVEHFS
jgi:hypothetical protein